ncbi:hypothetical protein [Roseateles amylovorans]|uniref:Uncharacterized protein n=1 Tax=Roseateles amylovorans TaxID=2978473 RepID=A0ABY6B1T4_9BURK|nr:hypothetical protein [Roseateles amylovorans]UXH79362.1 hypothetical protein N4261_05370 [Roseateles amylovorans]
MTPQTRVAKGESIESIEANGASIQTQVSVQRVALPAESVPGVECDAKGDTVCNAKGDTEGDDKDDSDDNAGRLATSARPAAGLAESPFAAARPASPQKTGPSSSSTDPMVAAAVAAARFGASLKSKGSTAGLRENDTSPDRRPEAMQSALRRNKLLAAIVPLLDIKPLLRLDDETFDDFLYLCRMYPSRSRFPCGNLDWLAPRRDITVRAALASLRERLQQAAAAIELVARLERDFVDENPLPDDDEAVVVAANVRDLIRGAMAMLGIIERALGLGEAMVHMDQSLVPTVREPAMRYAQRSGVTHSLKAH